jgi:energy-coupling factor transporter ATP-binding protein EcfA2
VRALLGENGAGKSTLIKILAGAFRAAGPGTDLFVYNHVVLGDSLLLKSALTADCFDPGEAAKQCQSPSSSTGRMKAQEPEMHCRYSARDTRMNSSSFRSASKAHLDSSITAAPSRPAIYTILFAISQ